MSTVDGAYDLVDAESAWRRAIPDSFGWVCLEDADSQRLLAEYDRRGAEIAELKSDLNIERDRYDELLADCGGVSS